MKEEAEYEARLGCETRGTDVFSYGVKWYIQVEPPWAIIFAIHWFHSVECKIYAESNLRALGSFDLPY